MHWKNQGHEFDILFEKMTNQNTSYRLWGAAEIGKHFLQTYHDKFHIVQLVDSSSTKQGQILDGIQIEHPSKLTYDKDSIVIVTCSYYEENRAAIEAVGYVPFVNLFSYKDFNTIYDVYQNNYLLSKRIDISLTERCTLQCIKCNMFMPYFKKPQNQPIEDVINDIDAYFSVVDKVEVLNLLGGEPFCYPKFEEVIEYIGKHYRDKIEKIIIFTNATIMPSESLLESIYKNNVLVQISDYSNVEGWKKKRDEFEHLLNVHSIEYYTLTFDKWGDFGFPENCNDLGKDKMLDFFERCKAPFRGLWKKRVYFCHLETSAIRAGLYQDNTNDYFDLTEKKECKKIYMEFDFGYSKDGYVSFCEKCRGCDCVNSLTVPAAEQVKRRKL